MKKILFITFLSINTSFGCEIVSSTFFLKFKGELTEVIQKSTCDDETNKKFLSLLSSSEGALKTDFLKAELNHVEKITPGIINIKKIGTLIKEKCANQTNLVVQVEEVNTNSISASSENDIQVNLNDCNVLGKKMFQVLGPKTSTWITINLQAEIMGYKIKSHLLSGQGSKISADMLGETKIITDSPEKYFNDIGSISFSKLTRTVQNGEPIKKSDLITYNLIELQFPTQVLFEKNGISIESYAQPMSTGKIGEVIRLRNLKTKKEMAGRVIGPNKVEIVL